MHPLTVPRDDSLERPQGVDFNDIFRSHFGYVWNALRRLGIAERDLEDLTQQVFLDVYRRLESFEPGRPVRPWLFGFALRAASNHRRLARHVLELFRTQEAPAAGPLPDELLVAREDAERAERALSRVELNRRAVLLLHEVDGHTIPEIAEALQIPLNTAYSRLRLARDEYERAFRRLELRGGKP
jgi:RNA polymerase sigma-70 factor (ECF subfamily)